MVIHGLSLEAYPCFLNNPQGHNLNKLDTVYHAMLYSKCQGILLVTCYVFTINGHNLTKIGRGLLGVATYQYEDSVYCGYIQQIFYVSLSA